MSQLSKAQKYFKKAIVYWFEGYTNYPKPDQTLIDMFYEYVHYLKMSSYFNIFNDAAIQKLVDEHTDAITKPAFIEGVEVMKQLIEPTIILLTNENNQLKNQLENEKQKRRSQQKTMLAYITKLENELKGQPCVMAKMHMAYKAGQSSKQLIERRPLNPELQPYITLAKGMGFRTWANQIYKYGKAKLHMPTNNYRNLPDDMNLFDLKIRGFDEDFN